MIRKGSSGVVTGKGGDGGNGAGRFGDQPPRLTSIDTPEEVDSGTIGGGGGGGG